MYNDLSTFFNQFFVLLSSLEMNMTMQKEYVSNLALYSPQEKYAKLVAPYTLSFIKKQLSLQCFKLYSCVMGIHNIALPSTNEHNSENNDSINGNISLKITRKLIYSIRWVS